MGGRAYGTLAESLTRGPRRALGQVFGELAAKFQPMVDALGEIGAREFEFLLQEFEVAVGLGFDRFQGL